MIVEPKADGAAPFQPISKHGWYTLVMLVLIYLLYQIDRSIINVLLEPIKQDLGLTDTQLGVLSGLSYSLASAAAALPLGYLVDRTNRVKLLSGLLIAWSIFTLFSGVARNFLQLLAARVMVGLTEAGASPASMSIIGDHFPRSRRSTAVSALFAANGAAIAAVFIGGGIVVSHFGWRAAFFIAGAPGLILAIIFLLTVREPIRGAMDAAGANAAPSIYKIPETLRFALRQRALLFVFFGSMLAAALNSSFVTWMMSLAIRVHEFELRDAAMTIGVIAALSYVVSAAFGVIADALAKRSIFWLTLLPAITISIAAIFGLGAAFAADRMAFLLMIVGFQFTSHIYPGIAFGLTLSLLKPGMRGFMMSVGILGSSLGAGLGPFMVGILSDLYAGGQALQWAFATVMLVGFAAAISFSAANLTLRADLARAETPDAPV